MDWIFPNYFPKSPSHLASCMPEHKFTLVSESLKIALERTTVWSLEEDVKQSQEKGFKELSIDICVLTFLELKFAKICRD